MANEHDVEPLLTNQQNQLSLSFSDSNSLDAKALAIFAANVAIIIFINQTAGGQNLWQYLLLYGPFGLSLVLNLYAITPRQYIGAGVDPARLSEYLGKNRNDLLLQLLSNTQAAILHNTKLNKKRLVACYWSIILTGFGFLALLFIL